MTRGYGILNHTFDSLPTMSTGNVGGRQKVFLYQWKTELLRLIVFYTVEERGVIFVEPVLTFMKE